MLASVVIRTYNEEKYLDKLLTAVGSQKCELVDVEVVIVDSGSTDKTLDIAREHNCRITQIKKSEFTFGRSLNLGCEFANGDFFIFVSGHCIPVNDYWLDEICRPLIEGVTNYSYGRQEGKDTTKYSEYRHFDKWFPKYSKVPQKGYFCNNANAAVTRGAWETYGFDEELSGLEDMHLAQKLVKDGSGVGYVATSSVYHIHDETWAQVRVRYEREAYALNQIMPQVHFSIVDFFRYFFSSVVSDSGSAIKDKVFLSKFIEIVLFRYNQYLGTYKGNHEVRKLSQSLKHRYFYPKDLEKEIYDDSEDGGTASNEGQQ